MIFLVGGGGGGAWWLLSPTNPQNAEYFRKLHVFVCTFMTFRLHRILLAIFYVLLGLRSYAYMSNSKFKGLQHEFDLKSQVWLHETKCKHHFITSSLKW